MHLRYMFEGGPPQRLRSAYLTVNRGNAKAIRAYERNGFKVVRTQVTDIGNGFVMDDYVMEKVF